MSKMTLGQAIVHSEKVAKEKLNNAVNIRNKMKSETALENAKECEKCAEEHKQLAEWLKDYKRLKEQEHILYEIEKEINSSNRGTCDYYIVDRIEEIINEYKTESEVKSDDY